MNKSSYIEEQINHPFNRSVIGYTDGRVSGLRYYFIEITNRRYEKKNISIEESEVAYWSGIINGANLMRKKKEVEKKRKYREYRDKKLKLMAEGKKVDPDIDPEVDEEDLATKVLEVIESKDISDVIKGVEDGAQEEQ